MSKKQFRSQASSSRAVSSTLGSSAGPFGGGSFGAASPFGAVSASPISYIYEPPDLSGISKPNVVVALKNLQKKDSITKAKALEELLAYIASGSVEREGVEDAFLEAWTKLYPRTSIDSSRRVRQLAHVLQGDISSSCGKRIAKQMPYAIGAWLAGLQDSDKLAARAARDAFQKVFSTEEKQNNVRRVYQQAIIEYCRDVVLKETARTMSDERTTSPDDAEAKYSRVIGTTMLTVADSIDNLPMAEIQVRSGLYQELLQASAIWKFSSYTDAFVRRGTYKLITAVLAKQELDILDFQMISMHVLQDTLNVDQFGSSYEYVKMVARLSTRCPEVWTRFYAGSGKKSASKRLCQFLRKGSQGGPVDYWNQIATLLQHLPSHLMEPDHTDAIDSSGMEVQPSRIPVISALHEGITRKDEHRSNHAQAWRTYLLAVSISLQSSFAQDSQSRLLCGSVVPIIDQYIRPSPVKSHWTVQGPEQDSICAAALKIVISKQPELFHEIWKRLSAAFIQDLQTSLPEQSKDYNKSQEAILLTAKKWYSLQASVLKASVIDTIMSTFKKTTSAEMNAAVQILKARDGKPFGVAATVDAAIRLTPRSTVQDGGTKEMLLNFVQSDVPNLLLSQSSPHLIDIVNAFRDEIGIQQTIKESVRVTMAAPDSPIKTKVLRSLISSSWFGYEGVADDMTTVVNIALRQTLQGSEESWPIVMAAIGNSSAAENVVGDLLARMTESLSVEDTVRQGLHGLALAMKENDTAFRKFSASRQGATLLSKLIFLTDSSDEDVSQEARNLDAAVRTLVSTEGTSVLAKTSMISIIKDGVDTAEPNALSIQSLETEAIQLFVQATTDERHRIAEELLPGESQWTKALQPFLSTTPDDSLAITNSIGGGIRLIKQSHGYTTHGLSTVPRDSNGYSSALRMAWFVTGLCTSSDVFDQSTLARRSDTCRFMALFVQLATDALGVPREYGLWINDNLVVEDELVDFIAQAQSLLAHWLHRSAVSDSSFVHQATSGLLAETCGLSSTAYYSARAYVTIISELEESGNTMLTSGETECNKAVQETSDPINASALLLGIHNKRFLLRLCNKLIADLSGLDFRGLHQILLLNCTIPRLEDVEEIPQPRIVVFVKHLMSHLRSGTAETRFTTEVYKTLLVILPPIRDIYGSFWETIISDMVNHLSRAPKQHNVDIPLIHATLRLYSTVNLLAMNEANDDLAESWKEEHSKVVELLVGLTRFLADSSDTDHQPRRMVNELLERQLSRLSPGFHQTPGELYSVLASESAALQRTAYGILHNQIPQGQASASIETALSKDFIAKLPEELLSLILTAPRYEPSIRLASNSILFLQIKGYLLSWKLVFDHWTNASYKLQSDYMGCIREESYLKGFLDFTFDFLVGSRPNPVDASSFNIEVYELDLEDSPYKDIQWLVIHLYYLCLKNLPALAKSWWRDDCPRQLQKSVEAWTGRYISPTVVLHELDTVAKWLPTQDTADQSLTVKVSPRVRELTASYPIDEQHMSIRISLPSTFPLSPVIVESVHRVGVDEKKWRAWLLTTAGVINFSGVSGAIIEGLVAWRKNVTGALKGQSECAICYSVVSQERTLPTKKCQVCKNLFHGSCLYKWFRSSSSSSCPLCRNPFNYG